MKVSTVFAAVAVASATVGFASSSRAAFLVTDFEDGTLGGFTVNAGPAANGVTATNIVPTGGTAANTDTTHVLDIHAPGFNQDGSYTPGVTYNFSTPALRNAFLANDILTFTFEVAPSAATSGYAQLYQVVLNAPDNGSGIAGYKTVGGTAAGDNTTQTFAPFNGRTVTESINYDAYKAGIAANPGYIQLSLLTQQGGNAPSDFYIDNLSLKTVPEPTAIAALGLGGVSMIKRRRRA